MLLGEFLKEYSSRKGEKDIFRQICRENNISYKKLRPYMKQLGFKYDQKNFEWQLAAENAPEEDQIMALDLKSFAMRPQQQQITEAEEDQQQQAEYALSMQLESADHVQQQHAGSTLPIITAQLFDIVDLLQQLNSKMPQAAQQIAATADLYDPEAAPLALQIHRISQQDKSRKTINISQKAAHWLDSFSAAKGFTIGDLVTLAIQQLKERIDPEA